MLLCISIDYTTTYAGEYIHAVIFAISIAITTLCGRRRWTQSDEARVEMKSDIPANRTLSPFDQPATLPLAPSRVVPVSLSALLPLLRLYRWRTQTTPLLSP